MKLSVEGQLRRAVWGLFAVGAASALMDSPAAIAQTSDATQLQGVEVTGSRIRRTDTESSNLVQTLDRKQIEATGATTLTELIQSIPALTGSPVNSSANNIGGSITGSGGSFGGDSSIDVRGLGPQRTLVLVDGQRVANGSPDAIPINMIERVEILKEGAGAVYGSDAIGGVVNFITRKNFSGVEATAQYGKTQRDDGAATGVNITWGSTGSKYSAVFGVDFNDQRKIRATDRPVTSGPTGYAYGHPLLGAYSSSRAPTGRFRVPGFPNPADPGGAPCSTVTRIAGTDGSTAADFRCFNNFFGPGGDRFNYQPYNLDEDPSRRESLFGTGSYKLTDNIKWYGEAYYTHATSERELAPEPFDVSTITGIFPLLGAPTISANNIYNPFGQDITFYAKRSSDAGGRVLQSVNDTYQFNTGFKGSLFDRFEWDVAYSYGREDSTGINRGYLDFSKLFQSLGPSFINAQGAPTCGTAANPILDCTPLNIFGTKGATLASIGTITNDFAYGDEQDFNANINGDLFNLPAGPLQLALGAAYRSLHADSIPDQLQREFQLSEANFQETSGGYNQKEVYAESHVPIAANLPGVKSFDLNLGVRYTNTSTSDTGVNIAGKYAFEYRPYSDLLIRGTYSDTFRAPNTGELFGGAAQSAPGYVDPCLGLSPAQLAAHPKACAGVPANATQPNGQGNAESVGNPLLKPELGYSTDFGAVFNPSFYKPLTVTADYYHYTLKNAISGIQLQQVLDACFANEASPFCGTAPDGQPYTVRSNNAALDTTSIANAQLPTLNAFSIYEDGWDGEVKLAYPGVKFRDIALGSFDFGLDVTYITNFQIKQFDPSTGAETSSASVAGTFDAPTLISGNQGTNIVSPRWRGLGFLFWSYGPVGISVEDRYIGNLKINADDAGTGAPYNSGYANYVDLAGTYTVKKLNTSFTVGVNDLFDDGIQATYDDTTAGAPAPIYDVRGRNFYGKVTVRFK